LGAKAYNVVNFDREGWRPLFLREPVSQRAWNLVTRGLRVYLMRVAEDDGTLLKRCTDPFELASSLGVHAGEVELVRGAIESLLGDGFLQWAGDAASPGWLGIDRLVTFDGPSPSPVESAEDRCRRLARDRKRRSRGTGERDRERDMSREPSVTDSVTGTVTDSVTCHAPLPSPLPSERDKHREKEEKEKKKKSGSGSRDSVTVTVTDSVTGSVTETVTSPSPSQKSMFAPADFEPNERHLVRCQELRLDVGVLLRKFRTQEFNRSYSNWDNRFDQWIETEKLKRESDAFQATRRGAKPKQDLDDVFRAEDIA
jgi:hypothetical protein